MRWRVIAAHYVDIETGEAVTKKEFKVNYTKLKTIKKIKYDKHGNSGSIELTTTGRRKAKQLTIEGI